VGTSKMNKLPIFFVVAVLASLSITNAYAQSGSGQVSFYAEENSQSCEIDRYEDGRDSPFDHYVLHELLSRKSFKPDHPDFNPIYIGRMGYHYYQFTISLSHNFCE
jgi:hypothetical protein